MNNRNRGLYRKFKVQRTDGRDMPDEKHHGCEYFVLDLTDNHDPSAWPALKAYADACRAEYPELAADLDAKISGAVTPPHRGPDDG